jgi:hypothetical protein
MWVLALFFIMLWQFTVTPWLVKVVSKRNEPAFGSAGMFTTF